MKRIKLSDTKWFMLLLLMCVPIISSCSKEDLPAYEEAEITKVGAYHRFYSGDKDAITGENIVAEKELDPYKQYRLGARCSHCRIYNSCRRGQIHRGRTR
ncbi:hypothetical protein NXW46_03230 [Bacteroides fragilis]|nr:hypothetical protein NXW46_03230 [Bacteroides fragilis]